MSDAFVVDASMAFAWVKPSQASDESDALLERIEQGATAVVPPLWFLEVANGLLVAQRRKLLTAMERTRALDRLSGLALTVDDGDARIAFSRTSALAEEHGLSLYDAAYLEVALRRTLPIASRDETLLAAAARAGAIRLAGSASGPPSDSA